MILPLCPLAIGLGFVERAKPFYWSRPLWLRIWLCKHTIFLKEGNNVNDFSLCVLFVLITGKEDNGVNEL